MAVSPPTNKFMAAACPDAVYIIILMNCDIPKAIPALHEATPQAIETGKYPKPAGIPSLSPLLYSPLSNFNFLFSKNITPFLSLKYKFTHLVIKQI